MIYEEPTMEICFVVESDIVTLSGDGLGNITDYDDDFDNLFGNK